MQSLVECHRRRFNLSILECKSVMIGASRANAVVLIYPYWNVNLRYASQLYVADNGFNLSILECKFFSARCRCARRCVLIYPYWNVNLYADMRHAGRVKVLIYPYWNVNLSPASTSLKLSVF